MSKAATTATPGASGEPARPVDGASLLAVGEALLEAAGRDPDLGLALTRNAAPGAEGPGHDQWHVATRLATRPGAANPDVGFGTQASLATLAREVRDGTLGRWLGDIRQRLSTGRLHAVRPAAMDTPGLVRARLALELVAPPARSTNKMPHAPTAPAEHPQAMRLVFTDAGDQAPTLRSRRRRL